jgi:hypothetical protein
VLKYTERGEGSSPVLNSPFGSLVPKYFDQIIWFSNLLTRSVEDAGYLRNVSCALNQISSFCHNGKCVIQLQ